MSEIVESPDHRFWVWKEGNGLAGNWRLSNDVVKKSEHSEIFVDGKKHCGGVCVCGEDGECSLKGHCLIDKCGQNHKEENLVDFVTAPMLEVDNVQEEKKLHLFEIAKSASRLKDDLGEYFYLGAVEDTEQQKLLKEILDRKVKWNDLPRGGT